MRAFSCYRMMNIQALNRYRAFAGHLFLSTCIASACAALVFFMWYPGLLAPASGVRNVFLMLLFVDVMLGPVITLIIFNPEKKASKELKRDLTIIVLVQLAALFYGMHAVFAARPVYLVFNVDRFDLVYANEIDGAALAKATSKEFQSLPLFGYRLVAAKSPEELKVRNEILFNALSGGVDLPQMPQYYLPYAKQKTEVLKHIQPLSRLKEFNKDKFAIIDGLVNQYVTKKTDVGFLPLKAKVNDLAVLVNRNTGEVLTMVDMKPWM